MLITVSLDDMKLFEKDFKRFGYKHSIHPAHWDGPYETWLVGRKVKFQEDLGHGMKKITKCRVAKAALLWGDDIDDNFVVFNNRKGNIYKTVANTEIKVK